ncbi:MAG: hypothetical protein AAFN79_07115 [Pseudomonadota bacterium]
MKRTSAIAALAVSSLLASQTLAADCALTYETFEAGVGHTDMADCPEGLGGESLFCRFTLVAETAAVFVFSEETDCLVTSRVYEEEDFKISFE